MTATHPLAHHALTEPFGFPEATLDRRFEAIVAAHPDRLAVDDDGRRLTYAQLNARANRLAHALLAVVPQARQPLTDPTATPRVGLFVDQGLDLATAVLASVKAGCAYVPLDPTYPDEKNRHMLADAGPAAILTYASAADRADTLTPWPLAKVLIDAIPDDADAANPGLDIEPHRLAYVLYTSGSTGRPKGVMQTHRSVLHNAAVHTQDFRITPDDRQTLLYPCSVYGGVRDTWNALLNGASLHHYPVREAGYDGLQAWLSDHRISLYCSVASVFRHFARRIDESGQPADTQRYADLRIIKLGGEAPLPADLQLYRRHFPDTCELSCGLGSTETGMSCRFPIHKDTILEGSTIPLGRPVHGMEVLLLDERRNPVAEGEIGEMAIRSRYITEGYLGRDDLNATVFTRDESDPRLVTFHTGDLARRNAAGDYVHRGRKDYQVKVRGNRVELQEVEAALESHPRVRDAVVLANTDARGDVRLIAYLTLEDPGGADAADDPLTARVLREHLKARVARFAIPNVYVGMDAIPLTPNGKRDRLALPGPETPGLALLPAGGDFVEPSSEMEASVAAVFARVLKLPASAGPGFAGPSVVDSFFDLGGDSLQAVGLILGIEKELGQRLELAALISHPSVRQLAELLSGDHAQRDAANHAPVVAFFPKSETRTRTPLFMLSGQGGSVLCYHDLARRLPGDRPIYGLQFPGINAGETPLDRIAPLAEEITRRMRRVQPEGPYWLLGYSFGAVVAYEMAEQLMAVGQRVEYLGILDCQAPGTKRPLPRPQRMRVQWRDFKRMGWANRLAWIKAKLRGESMDIPEYQVQPDPAAAENPELIARLNALSAASRRAYLAYQPLPQTHTPLTLFRCAERHGWMDFYEDHPDRGWSRYAPLRQTLEIPGKHLEIFKSVHAEALAAQVRRSLES